MTEKNPGDVLTCDWNPFVGYERYSPGCDNCWFLDGRTWDEFPYGYVKKVSGVRRA